MNAELCKKALEKIGNPNVLINLVSRRVRQLSSGGGAGSRPFVAETATQGTADIALREITEDKVSWEAVEEAPAPEDSAAKKRKK